MALILIQQVWILGVSESNFRAKTAKGEVGDRAFPTFADRIPWTSVISAALGYPHHSLASGGESIRAESGLGLDRSSSATPTTRS